MSWSVYLSKNGQIAFNREISTWSWKQTELARLALTYPPSAQLGHPGLPAKPTTSPRAFGPLKTVSAVLGKCTREVRQPSRAVIADRTPQGSAAPRPISFYHHTVSRNIELSLLSSFQIFRYGTCLLLVSQGHI